MQCSDAVKSLALAPLAPTRERGLGVRGQHAPHRFPNRPEPHLMLKDRRMLSQRGNPPLPPASLPRWGEGSRTAEERARLAPRSRVPGQKLASEPGCAQSSQSERGVLT